jgi:hypothetical protein
MLQVSPLFDGKRSDLTVLRDRQKYPLSIPALE